MADGNGLVRPVQPVLIYKAVGPDGEDRSRYVRTLKAQGATTMSLRVLGADFHGLYRITHFDEQGVWGVLLEQQKEEVRH